MKAVRRRLFLRAALNLLLQRNQLFVDDPAETAFMRGDDGSAGEGASASVAHQRVCAVVVPQMNFVGVSCVESGELAFPHVFREIAISEKNDIAECPLW